MLTFAKGLFYTFAMVLIFCFVLYCVHWLGALVVYLFVKFGWIHNSVYSFTDKLLIGLLFCGILNLNITIGNKKLKSI
jgi:hypothetical protein